MANEARVLTGGELNAAITSAVVGIHYKNAVERLTGRKVVAFISGNNTNPDIASELFVLDRPVSPPRSPSSDDPAAADQR
jgi:uncharacterized protein YbcI